MDDTTPAAMTTNKNKRFDPLNMLSAKKTEYEITRKGTIDAYFTKPFQVYIVT